MLLGTNIRKFAKSLSSIVGTVQFPSFQSYSIAFFAVLAMTQSASSSILKKISTTEMTRQAKEVVIGDIVSTYVSPEPDQKLYVTYVKLVVKETLKGKKRGKHKREILLRQAGGDYPSPITGRMIHQKVFGMQTFKAGESGVFFLTRAVDGAPTVMFQGKHEIVKDKESGVENIVTENSPDVESPNALSSLHLEPEQRRIYAVYDERPLTDMVREIQNAVTSEEGEQK